MLDFSPLYWVYHDNWQFEETVLVEGRDKDGNKTLTPQKTKYDHAGHIHFFMMNFNSLKNAKQQAYTGAQEYSFSIQDVWGPNSSDENQSRSYKLIGKPRWYFYIEEYWRRVYIQPWDQEDYTEKYPNHPERIGIKYDASKPEHSFGPFREGGGLYFFNTELNRTLPVEYWLDEEKTKREHVLRRQHYVWDETTGNQVWNFEKDKRSWMRHGRGWYWYWWEGDNAYYKTIYEYDWEWEEYAGYNKPGDVVKIGSGNSATYWKYSFIPSEPLISMGANYWPNPTPGASISQLRSEYLTYFDFESEYGDRYTNEYSNWLRDHSKSGTQTDFEEFLSIKAEEFQRNCLSDDLQTLRYEYIGFEDYCSIWVQLSREEIIKLGVYGDYPLLKPGMSIPTSNVDFGPEGDPFHKDGVEVNPYEVYKKYFENRESYVIPRGRIAKGDYTYEGHPRALSFSDEDGARRFYSDNLYITPVIEYQQVVHLNYERLPERKAAEEHIDVWTDKSGNFGDGFSVTITIPFRVNGVIQSPFSDDSGKVYPPGNYFHNFKEENKLRYSIESFGTGIDVNSDDFSGDLEKKMQVVEKYRRSEYLRFMQNNPSELEQANWFNENYANTPITMNEEEGMFDSESNWIEVTTHDRPRIDQVVRDINDKPTMEPMTAKFSNPGYKEDGIWVEQCLGAKVIPRVELIFEDALGHRFSRIVDASQMEASSSQPFVGKS